MWFEVPEEERPGRVLIREVKDSEITEAHIQATTTRPVDSPTGVVVEQTTAIGRVEDAMLCATVKNWEGFEDEKGKSMECTNLNKLRYAKEAPWFRPFIQQCARQATEIWNGNAEAAAEN
jgi:hypothetical protein